VTQAQVTLDRLRTLNTADQATVAVAAYRLDRP
jgi:hypothetical protein